MSLNCEIVTPEEIETLRSRFLFAEPAALDAILAEIPDARDWERERGAAWCEAERLRSASSELSGRLSQVRQHMDSFPLRHRENLKTCIEGNHPAWRAKLDVLRAQLGKGSIFALLGARGTGKTQLATALARSIEERPMTTLRCTYGGARTGYEVLGDVFSEIKSTFRDKPSNTEHDIIAFLASLELLVLDEVHETNGTEWNVRVLTMLMDARYRQKRDTVLIANMTQDELLGAVGPSVASRMDECGFFITCDWPSFRGLGRDLQ